MALAALPATGEIRLPAYALFAAVLAAAGLPIYIHAPKFYVDEYGVSLAALGVVLFGLRLLDVVQDPLLGRLAARLQHRRGPSVALAGLIMAGAMLGLFAVDPPVAPMPWFALMLALLFSAFSYLNICFYAQGVLTAQALGGSGHLRLARWRETGALLGVCVAAIAPVALGSWLSQPFAGFALGFCLACLLALVLMRAVWSGGLDADASPGFGTVLRDGPARRLLLIALVNAAPVAVSSTLFLFFVEYRLGAADMAGPLLVLFFLCAALSAPVWSKLAERFGPRPVLIAAMGLAILSFGGAGLLETGDVLPFALVCALSGAATGADLTLLPAMFARRMAVISPSAAEGFGLWSFVSKLTLALAAITVLPLLDGAGLSAGSSSPTIEALGLLSLLYAGLPCLLKTISIALLATLSGKEC